MNHSRDCADDKRIGSRAGSRLDRLLETGLAVRVRLDRGRLSLDADGQFAQPWVVEERPQRHV